MNDRLDHRQTAGRQHRGASWRAFSLVMALVVLVSVLVMPSASANKGRGKGGPSIDSGVPATSCDRLGGSTTTLTQVNAAIRATDLPGANGEITGAGVDVAVIDTGVNDIGLSEIIDGPDLSFDASAENLRNRDLHGHGTNMAAIIATDTSSEQGVAPGSRIVNVKVGAGDGSVDVSQVIAAIDWVVEHRHANGMDIRVINLAYSTDAASSYRIDPLSHAVENAWHNGIVVVAAGGNDGRGIRRLGNPAINPFVIAVGAAKRDGSEWFVPNWTSSGDGSRNPDLVAPGQSILSAAVPGSYLADSHASATCPGSDGRMHLRGSGTSQAAAVVAGAVARLLEQRPYLTPDQVKYVLTSTARNIDASRSHQGAGMLDLGAALNAPTPGVEAVQLHPRSTGGGSLDVARGSAVVAGSNGAMTGDRTAFGGSFDAAAHSMAEITGSTWTGSTWTGSTWTGGEWSGSTWTGSTWTGGDWSGSTWTGSTWTGSTWTGSTWTGSTWTGSTWTGSTWTGAVWSGDAWD